MKKVYIKPYLAVESFQLNAAIAASCSEEGFETLNRYKSGCTHESGWFAGDVCDLDAVGEDGDFDEPCYHGPITTGNMPFIYS